MHPIRTSPRKSVSTLAAAAFATLAALGVDATASGVLNADGPHKYKDPKVVREAVRCKLAPLSPVTLSPRAPAASAPARA